MKRVLIDVVTDWSNQGPLSFFLTDDEGHIVTPTSLLSGEGTSLFHHSEQLKDQLSKAIHNFGHATEPVVVEILQQKEQSFKWIKTFMLGVSKAHSPALYLWSGWFTDLKKDDNCLFQIPLLTIDEKRMVYDHMQKCKNALLPHLMSDKEESRDPFLTLFDTLIKEDSLQSFFDKAKYQWQEVDIIGLAIWKNDRLQVDYCSNLDWLLDKLSFMSGEGYIGKTFATGKPESWKIDEFDPRAQAMSLQGQPLKWMACFPVQYEASRLGVLFLGSNQGEHLNTIMDLSNTLARLLAIKLQFAYLTDQEHIYAFQLSTLMEMVRSYDQLKDKKAIASLVLDICSSVLQTTSCLIYYPSDAPEEEAILDSRGLTLDQHQLYAREIAYRLKTYKEAPVKDPELKETVFKQSMFECLLWNEYRKQAGVIAFGQTASGTTDFFYSYLQLIAKVTNVALNRVSRELILDNQVTLLTEAMAAIHPERYRQLEEAEGLCRQFLLELGDPAMRQFEEELVGIKMVDFPVSVLRKTGMKETVIRAIGEFQEMMKRQSYEANTELSRLMYLGIQYCSSKNQVQFIEELAREPLEEGWYEAFVSACSKKEALGMNGREVLSNKWLHESGFEQLTKREWEILEMLALGLKNHDMANIMHISDFTVKNHVSNLYKKLGIKNRSQATSLYLNYNALQKSTNHV